jgi:hypothetical protein
VLPGSHGDDYFHWGIVLLGRVACPTKWLLPRGCCGSVLFLPECKITAEKRGAQKNVNVAEGQNGIN